MTRLTRQGIPGLILAKSRSVSSGADVLGAILMTRVLSREKLHQAGRTESRPPQRGRAGCLNFVERSEVHPQEYEPGRIAQALEPYPGACCNKEP